MDDIEEFKRHGHKLIDWMAGYLENVEKYPVKPNVKPKDIYNSINFAPPSDGENMKDIIDDFENKIIPGITHWQHPNFHAYFPSNNSVPSVLAEMLTATLGVQGMIWDTSPAAAELEDKMMEWLRDLIGLPSNFHGVIQDSASSATLAAILTSREIATNFKSNEFGIQSSNLRVYCSMETHSSVEKAVKIAGIGKRNLVKIEVDENLRLNPIELEKSVKEDIKKGFKPACIVASFGTTSTTAVDPINEIGEICRKYGIWLHIDAAYAGTALILEKFQPLIKGIEKVDSFVFNPHKWMFTNFDCSAYFVKNKDLLLRTFEILPEYLKTESRGQVNDYRDWGVPLGRRFRSLKLWFVIRNFGVEGIKRKLREQLHLARLFEKWIIESKNFEILTPAIFNLICFRYRPSNISDENEIDRLNQLLIKRLNDSGKIYLTHTKIHNKYALRMVIAQTRVQEKHIKTAWNLIKSVENELLGAENHDQ